jgi:hypothetical protein
MLVDRLVYRFWNIGTIVDNMLAVWICFFTIELTGQKLNLSNQMRMIQALV